MQDPSLPETMAPSADPLGMTAPAMVQHPMHAMIAPISAAPPKVTAMSPDGEPFPTKMSTETPKSQASQMSPLDQRESQLEQGLQKKPQGFWGNFGHYAGMAGRIAGDIVAPGQTETIVGTLGKEGIGPRANEMRNSEIADIEKQKSEQGLQGAQTNAANAHAEELTPVSAPESITAEHPELADLQLPPNAWQRLASTLNTNQTRTSTNENTVEGRKGVAQMNNETKSDIADANNLTKEKLAQLKPEQRDDKAISLWQKKQEGQPLTQDETAYLGAYNRWVDETKVKPGVARAQAFGAFRPVQVVGPDGNVQYQYSGNAIKSGASTPQSMNFRTASQLARYMTSGKGGSTLTAYRTAYDHLDLLQQASDALENGDVQGLNLLQNGFNEQFGSNAPTNFDAVKTMLAGEIANVAKASGATDQEIAAARAEMNRAQSPEQIKGIIQTNQGLMDQKAQEMLQQYQSGMQGQPTFGHGKQPVQNSATPARPSGVPATAKYITDPSTGKKGWAW